MEINEKVDQILQCQDCQKEFKFSWQELRFYKQKGLFYPPKRCSFCRIKRRASIDASQMEVERDGK